MTKIANQGKNVFNGIMESTLGTNLLGKENINLYVYYAGHGALSESGDAYFLPVDANPEKNFLEDQSINQNKFYDQLMDLENVKNVYAFIDACFSGLPKDRENKYLNNNIENDANEGRNIRAISPNKLNNKYKRKITVFTASSADQVSYSYRYFNSKYNQNNLSISNGLFTTFLAAAVQLNDDGLMNADDNKDNQLTNKEIYEYINRNVSSFSKNEQQPDWAGNNFENIIIK